MKDGMQMEKNIQCIATVINDIRPNMGAEDYCRIIRNVKEVKRNHGMLLSALLPFYETIAQGYLNHTIEPNMRKTIDYYMVYPFDYKKISDFLPMVFKGLKNNDDINHVIMMWKLMIPMLNDNDSRFLNMIEELGLSSSNILPDTVLEFNQTMRIERKIWQSSPIIQTMINSIVYSDININHSIDVMVKFMKSTMTGRMLLRNVIQETIRIPDMKTIIHNKDIDMLTSAIIDKSLTGDGITWMHDHYSPQNVDVAEMANMCHRVITPKNIRAWKLSNELQQKVGGHGITGSGSQYTIFRSALRKSVNRHDEDGMNAAALLMRVLDYETNAYGKSGIINMDDEFVRSDTFSSMVSDGMPINVIAESGFSWEAF